MGFKSGLIDFNYFMIFSKHFYDLKWLKFLCMKYTMTVVSVFTHNIRKKQLKFNAFLTKYVPLHILYLLLAIPFWFFYYTLR